MSELFEEDEAELVEIEEEFEEVADVETDTVEVVQGGLDARRRLEQMLEEKRLRDELDDFVDF